MEPEQPIKTKYASLQQLVSEQVKAKWQHEQNKIKEKIVHHDEHEWEVQNVRLVAGVDLSASTSNPDVACAGLVVYDVREKRIEYEDYEIMRINQPYIPGFLAFRQIPPLYSLFSNLKKNRPELWPQLLLVDGNGILHSNQCGLACHLGVILGIPSIGVGKTLFFIDGLTKDRVKQVCESIQTQNEFTLLVGDSGRVWGAGLLNGKNSKNPVYVSIGTKVSLETAIECVILVSQHRVPQPIRLADKKSREIILKIDPNTDISVYKQHEMIFLENIS